MATIKSYTDIEQSKKLAEFLPIESTDMTYCAVIEDARDKTTIRGWEIATGTKKWEVSINAIKNNSFSYRNGYIVPCWSLAALLDIIPYAIHKSDNEFYRLGIDKGYNDYAIWYSNNGLTINDLDVTSDSFVDACVEMILKLHEQNIL